MKAVPSQQHFDDMSGCQPHLSSSVAANFRFATVLSVGLAAVSLLMATPAFGKATAIAVISSEKQNMTYDVQRLGETSKTIAFVQKPSGESMTEATQSASSNRNALLAPDLDERVSNILIWAAYLGLPLTLMVAIRYHDRYTREQMVNLVQQVTLLERIWQHPPTR